MLVFYPVDSFFLIVRQPSRPKRTHTLSPYRTLFRSPEPPNFLKTLFPDVGDAGADVVVGGGPHALRGIEIYKGKTIFYGIGVFFIRGEIKAMQEAAFRVFPDPTTGRAPPPEPESESVRQIGRASCRERVCQYV